MQRKVWVNRLLFGYATYMLEENSPVFRISYSTFHVITLCKQYIFFYNIHVFLSICLVYKNSKSFKYLNFSHPCHLYRQNEYQIHVINLKLEIDQSELFLFAKFIQEKFCKTRMYLLLGISNFQLFSATYIIFLYHQQENQHILILQKPFL